MKPGMKEGMKPRRNEAISPWAHLNWESCRLMQEYRIAWMIWSALCVSCTSYLQWWWACQLFLVRLDTAENCQRRAKLMQLEEHYRSFCAVRKVCWVMSSNWHVKKNMSPLCFSKRLTPVESNVFSKWLNPEWHVFSNWQSPVESHMFSIKCLTPATCVIQIKPFSALLFLHFCQ